MIATSVALTVWTAGLSYVAGRDKNRQVLEERDVEAATLGESARGQKKGEEP
jgi:hypothetical protein